MIKTTRFLILLLIIFGALAPAYAQSTAQTLTITHLEATAEENGEVRVSALVSVLDDAGQPVAGLTAADLSVSENTLPVDSQLLTVAAADTPLNVILLINTGSQMAVTGPNRIRAIDAAKDAAIALIERLGQDDQVAVYEFNSQAVRRQTLTYDHNLAIDQGVVPLDTREDEAACLNDALLQVIDQTAATTGTPQVIITLTGPPGGESCGVTPVEDVLKAATTIGSAIPIFTVAFGKNLDEDELLRLGQGSNGRTLLSEDSGGLADNLASVLNQLDNQIEISYPSSAAPGLVTVIVFENNAQLSDRQQVVIPQAIEPTATPPPQFSINLTVNQPSGDTLEIIVNNPESAELTQTSLYVNDELMVTADEPPFDKFVLPVNELGSGTHVIRVEATDVNDVSASAQMELMLTIPPAPTPTPAPVEAVAPGAADNAEAAAAPSLPLLPVALICVGAALLLALGGLIVYLLMSRSKQPAPATQPSPASAPVWTPTPPPPVPANVGVSGDVDAEKTILQVPAKPMPKTVPTAAGAATLVVISGEALVDRPEFSLQKAEIKIGRKAGQNDIVIKDPEVSRTHAVITRQRQQYFIQDLDSTLGTLVNGVKFKAGPATSLKDGYEIEFGPRVKFQFKLDSSVDDGETLIDMNVNDLRTKFEDKDPFRTQYDD